MPSVTPFLYSAKNTIEITIPITEPAELRELKFIEVRGVSRDDGSVEMRDYTNFQDGFGNFWYNSRSESIQWGDQVDIREFIQANVWILRWEIWKIIKLQSFKSFELVGFV